MAESAHPHQDGRRFAAPVFVVGAPRSGTTLVQRALLADPRACGGQESHFFVSFGKALRDFDRKRGLGRPHGLACYWTRAELIARIRALWNDLAERAASGRSNAQVLVEKTPDHALWLDVVAEVIPEARVVHVVRDSRAVTASLLAAGRARWGRDWAPKSASAAARIWREHVEGAEACRLPRHRVHFEDLASAPGPALAGLWSFVGLEADEARCRAFLEAARADRTPFLGAGEIAETPPEPAGFVREGSIDGWRRELNWLDRWRVWRETGDAMRRLGYGRDGRRERS